jgi:hypothetical protein
MPPRRKIDALPAEERQWLQDALRARGFAGYVEVTEELNDRLAARGYGDTLHPATVHRFGAEYAEFVRVQEAASDWATEWMKEAGIGDEAKRHNVLFQMITATAFKVLQAQINKPGEEIDPKDLHFIGRMMKDVMASSGIREQLAAAERKTQAAKLDAAVESGDIDAAAAEKARRIMGFA